ncbi:Vacuolar protein-sorting-associated protein 36 [Lecanora helva]
MFLQPLDLTTALRPSLLPDEALLFVQDAVGLYEGNYKIPNLQDGHAYLTTHRACFVNDVEPRKNSVAVELRAIDRYEFYAGFLRSSAKITFHPKIAKRPLIQGIGQSPNPGSPSRSYNASPIPPGASALTRPGSGSISPRPTSATWVCVICSFANPVPGNFDPATANSHSPLPPCLSCGIKPSFPHVLKAAIANAAGRGHNQAVNEPPAQPLLESHGQYNDAFSDGYGEPASSETSAVSHSLGLQCPRCTFSNHPSLLNCEICGLSLVSADTKITKSYDEYSERADSPGPSLDMPNKGLDDESECVKFSFRKGGEKIFYERLKNAMVQRKWLLHNAPPVPDSFAPIHDGQTNVSVVDGQVQPPTARARTVGIAGLERQGLELRKKNEAVIGSAFEDLDALMASAKEIIALAESFAQKSNSDSADANQLIAESAQALDMVTTKEMLGSSAGSESLYLSELSRNLAEFLTDDAKGILRKEGGIMSLVDLWAVFNRARGGVELISPSEFEKGARLWEKLSLPVRLRQFRNGLLVVQQADRTDDKTVAQLLSWLQDLHSLPLDEDVPWDCEAYGRGVTAQEAAQRFGWSIGVATEELKMAEEKGALCREEGVEGLRFWENWIENDHSDENPDDGIDVDPVLEIDPVLKNMEDMGLF